jgi:hypothetical protein
VSRMIRSRRAPVSSDLPLYGRMLGLRHLTPSGFLCFVFLEGAVALGILLALAELVSWWGVVVLPITVAAMVKLNDLIAGALIRPPVRAAAPAVGEFAMDDRALARVRTVDLRHPDSGASRARAEELELRLQQVRQSAARRYE